MEGNETGYEKHFDPMTDENLRWYALYTKPRWEKKVADLLTRKNVEAYCPLNRVQRQWSDRKKYVNEPLFRSYVFVHTHESQLLQIKQTDGVINCVFWLGKPAVIKDAEIDIIKRFLNDYRNVQVEKAEVNLKDKVRIINGPLIFQEGNVIEVMNKTVKVILSSLGYALVAEIDSTHVEKIGFLSQQEGSGRQNIKIKN